jgi:hypothetical protein
LLINLFSLAKDSKRLYIYENHFVNRTPQNLKGLSDESFCCFYSSLFKIIHDVYNNWLPEPDFLVLLEDRNRTQQGVYGFLAVL